jgi:hypothetical protein
VRALGGVKALLVIVSMAVFTILVPLFIFGTTQSLPLEVLLGWPIDLFLVLGALFALERIE